MNNIQPFDPNTSPTPQSIPSAILHRAGRKAEGVEVERRGLSISEVNRAGFKRLANRAVAGVVGTAIALGTVDMLARNADPHHDAVDAQTEQIQRSINESVQDSAANGPAPEQSSFEPEAHEQ